MKRLNVLGLCMVLLSVVGLESCAFDPVYSYPPEYGKLVFTTQPATSITLSSQSSIKTSSVEAGDSVTVFVQTSYAGDYITEAAYMWKLDVGNDSVVSYSVNVVAPHKENTPPKWTFRAPDSKGTYSVSFKAKYDYSAQTEVGTIYGESAMLNGDLRVR